jgi:outer membrane lipoprotein-sorting protein
VSFAAIAYGADAKVPALEEVLKRYDAIMGPETFDAIMTMTAHREDGTVKSYEMRAIKKGSDNFRLWFKKPAAVAGQEMLRVGDNSWIYLPNLKRTTRIANRDSFQGGDFNNADVLRVNYQTDYSGTVAPDEDPKQWLVSLKAKNSSVSYDAIKLWIARDTGQPSKGEYFGSSGKLMRSATFGEVKEFQKGYSRPQLVQMRNELVKARFSVLTINSISTGMDLADARFNLNDLGK